MKEKETSKLYNSITNVDNQFIEEAQTTKKNNWIKWVVTAAACLALICVVTINHLPHAEDDIVTTPGVADAPPMVCVNGKLYKQSTGQVSYDEVKSEFFYLGKIESDITNSQTSTDGVPKENFQANHPIVGAEVYQYNVDIVIQINGKYWLYCAVLDVDYTINDDGTYTCRGNTYKYKIEISGVDGESQVTYVVLTNNMETSFEDVAYSLRKAEMSTGIPEFVILGWYY